ncbi:MAG: hypothetical protein LW825_02795 [Candidatus Jidaibacter sp.]|nr:hypothetical protein [Candidatus Jidaibacter sp.]
MTNVALYTSKNIDSFIWQDSHVFEKHYLLPFIKEGAQKFIANVETETALLEVDGYIFPVTINNKEYESSYVCSPYNACISYSKEEMSKLGNKPLEFALQTLANISGLLLKSAKINKVVSINNWLLSTNLYQAWDGEGIKTMTDFLVQTFPDHVLMSRSLNEHTNPTLLKQYAQNGYDFVPSRQVYLFDKANGDYLKKNNVKWDFALLEDTGYCIVTHDEITPGDYSRITDLYNKLYLDKYSYHNPQFTIECIALWHKHKLVVMQGLRNQSGILDGIAGCFERDGITTAPLVGYDTALPQSIGLYRMLIALVIKRAHIHNMVLNCSSGASEFKRLRGAVPEIEYSVIYTKHLSLYRRVIWRILIWILSYIGVPLMRKYKL